MSEFKKSYLEYLSLKHPMPSHPDVSMGLREDPEGSILLVESVGDVRAEVRMSPHDEANICLQLLNALGVNERDEVIEILKRERKKR